MNSSRDQLQESHMPHSSPAACKLWDAACHRQASRAWYHANREHALARRKAWTADHCAAGSACRSYKNMLQRCTNPNYDKFHLYGGRGITIDPRWLGPNGRKNFEADMGPRPIGKTLDRKRVNGNYTPSNCRWATPEQQRANQRTKFEIRKAA
jgi:hypothetical protein